MTADRNVYVITTNPIPAQHPGLLNFELTVYVQFGI